MDHVEIPPPVGMTGGILRCPKLLSSFLHEFSFVFENENENENENERLGHLAYDWDIKCQPRRRMVGIEVLVIQLNSGPSPRSYADDGIHAP